MENVYADIVSASPWPCGVFRRPEEVDPGSLREDERVVMAQPGPARIVAYAAGHGLGVSPWIEVKAGSPTEVGIRLAPPSWNVHGDVLDSYGEPVQDARVTVVPEFGVDLEMWALLRRAGHFPDQKTWVGDDRGGFDYQWLPPGSYRFDVYRPYKDDDAPTLSVRASVPAIGSGTIPLRFDLPREASPRSVTVSVRAVDPEGAPIAGFRGGVFNDRFGYSFDTRDGVAIGRGWGIPPLDLHLSADGFRDVKVDVVERGEPYVVRLERIDPRLRISGTVTCGGRPVEWQRVRHCYGSNRGAAIRLDVTPMDGDPDTSSRVMGSLRANGEFEFELPRAGMWRLRATGEDEWQPDGVEVPLPAEVVVEAGARDVEISMMRGVPLTVKAALPEGAVLDRIEARLVDETGTTGERRLKMFAAEGELITFPSVLPDRDYTLLVAAKCGVDWTDVGRVEHLVPGREPQSVFLRGGRRVRVQVVRADGSPVIGAVVRRADVPWGFGWVTGLEGATWVTLPEARDATISALGFGLSSGTIPTTVAADAREVKVVVTPTSPSEIR